MVNLKNGLLAAVIGIAVTMFFLYKLERSTNDQLRADKAALENKVTALKGQAVPIGPPDSAAAGVTGVARIDTIYLEGEPIPADSVPEISFTFETGGRPIYLLDMMKSPSLLIDTSFTDDNRITTELSLLINRFTGDYSGRIKTIPPKTKPKLAFSVMAGITDEPFVGAAIRYGKVYLGPTATNKKIGFLLGLEL
jgi:hypothetical protein